MGYWIKNIYVRPVLFERCIYVSLSTKYKTEEVESIHTIDDAYQF
jgi:hypothetical protein